MAIMSRRRLTRSTVAPAHGASKKTGRFMHRLMSAVSAPFPVSSSTRSTSATVRNQSPARLIKADRYMSRKSRLCRNRPR